MAKKIIKLFNVPILTIDTYDKEDEAPASETILDKIKGPRGEILEYSPEEEEKDKERETLKKMEGK